MANNETVEINSKNSKIMSEIENVTENVSSIKYEEEASDNKSISVEESATSDALANIENKLSEEILVKPEIDETKEKSRIIHEYEELDPSELFQESYFVDDKQYDDEIETEVTSEMPNLSMSFDISSDSHEIYSTDKSEMKIVCENDKENLLDLYQHLNAQKKSVTSRNRTLNNALSEFMFSKDPNVFQDALTVDIVSHQKYNDALDRLYKVNHRREMVLEAENVESENLLREKKIIMDIATERRDKMVERLYDTGITLLSSQTGLPLSDKFVSKLIARFLKTQSDLSEARLNFIIIQNFFTEMKARNSELDNLGDGLTVIDYESMMSEVQGLQVVIESKNEELDRLRQRCFIDTHKIVHLGEKYSQLLWSYEQQNQLLNSRKMEEQNLRKTLNKIKKEKDDLRAQHNNLLQQAGLLNKVPLLKDYDNVIYQIKDITEKISHFESINKTHVQETVEMKKKIDEIIKMESGVKHLDKLITIEQEKLRIKSIPKVNFYKH
ncbi:unnamed protein product [Diamesa tonsa]